MIYVSYAIRKINAVYFFLAVIDAVVINALCIILKFIKNVPNVLKNVFALYQKFMIHNINNFLIKLFKSLLFLFVKIYLTIIILLLMILYILLILILISLLLLILLLILLLTLSLFVYKAILKIIILYKLNKTKIATFFNIFIFFCFIYSLFYKKYKFLF